MDEKDIDSTRLAWLAVPLAVILAAPTALAASLEELRQQGSIRVAVANEVPYGYLDDEGQGQGAGPEVARHVLEEIGIDDIEWVATSFGDLIPGLEEGRFDMAAAEMAIRPERCERVLFSRPTPPMAKDCWSGPPIPSTFAATKTSPVVTTSASPFCRARPRSISFGHSRFPTIG